MSDPGTLVLMAIAVPLLVLVSAGTPMVIRYHRAEQARIAEERRRAALTDYQRAMEDLGVALGNLGRAFAVALTPVVQGLTATFQGLADALDPLNGGRPTMGAERKELPWPSSR